MPRVPLTTRWVATVKPPAIGQVDYFEPKPPPLVWLQALKRHRAPGRLTSTRTPTCWTEQATGSMGSDPIDSA